MNAITTLGAACTLIVDCEHKTAPPAAPGTEYGFAVGTPHIRNGRILLDSAKPIDENTYIEWTARETPRQDDLILAREAPVGQVGRIREGERICLGQRTVLLRPNLHVANASYLHYLMLSPQMQETMHSRAAGSTVPHLNVKDIRSLPIPPLPDMEEQAQVGKLLGALDEKITVNEQIAATSLNLAELAYGASSSAGGGWSQVSIGETARWLSGGTPKTSVQEFWGGDIPWISAVSLKSPWVDDSERKLTDIGAQSGTRIIPADTVIFIVRGSSLDTEFRIGLTQRDVAFGQDCKALIAHAGIDPAVLFVAIKSKSTEILSLVDHAGHGAGRLATELITKVEILLPDADAAAEATARIRPLVEIGASKQRENRALANLRDVLLPKLISGELKIRDAERRVEEAT